MTDEEHTIEQRRTVGQACGDLGVSWPTLKKWLGKLGIEPTRYEWDLRVWMLTAADIERVRGARAEAAKLRGPSRFPKPYPGAARSPWVDRIGPVTRSEGQQTALPLAEIHPSTPRPRQRPVSASGEASSVPQGWQPLPEWCRLHDIPHTTAMKASQVGRYGLRFDITKEPHRQGRTLTSNWLTLEQQAAFHRAFADVLGDPCRICQNVPTLAEVAKEIDE